MYLILYGLIFIDCSFISEGIVCILLFIDKSFEFGVTTLFSSKPNNYIYYLPVSLNFIK